MFQKHGHYEIDSARTYTGGTSEEYLGKIDWKSRGLVMDTKLYPNAVRKTEAMVPDDIYASHCIADST